MPRPKTWHSACIACVATHFPPPRTEWERTMRHIGLHGLSLYPFPHSKEYFRLPPCQVSRDPANGLPYVMHNGKRLYFKAGMMDGKVNFSYRGLCVCGARPAVGTPLRGFV